MVGFVVVGFLVVAWVWKGRWLGVVGVGDLDWTNERCQKDGYWMGGMFGKGKGEVEDEVVFRCMVKVICV